MKSLFVIAVCLFSSIQVNDAIAQWNPKPGWKDSYAVGGKCYCDSNGYDHGLDRKTAPTPLGPKNVVEICDAIKAKLGTGSTQGRIPYNDIQCGNGPANDAPDEAPSACPGRVDIGPSGCQQKGPKWDLASVYGSTSGTALNRTGWALSASQNPGELGNAIDGSAATRWATRQTQRDGQTFRIDMRTAQVFNRIVLETAGNPNDYPRRYEVSVSDNGTNWRGPIASGNGNGSTTDIYFPNQSARFIRIAQRGSDSRYWWSIHEINVHQTGPGTGNSVVDSSNWQISTSSDQSNVRSAVDADAGTRWATRTAQRPGQFFQIDMKQTQRFDQIMLDSQDNPNDYPRSYRVLVSDDGANWRGPVATGAGTGPITTIPFPAQQARYIRIEQTGNDNAHWWSIHEMFVDKAVD
jgi:hypothetical protein